jgi:hypothetical protein
MFLAAWRPETATVPRRRTQSRPWICSHRQLAHGAKASAIPLQSGSNRTGARIISVRSTGAIPPPALRVSSSAPLASMPSGELGTGASTCQNAYQEPDSGVRENPWQRHELGPWHRNCARAHLVDVGLVRLQAYPTRRYFPLTWSATAPGSDLASSLTRLPNVLPSTP